MMSDEASAAPAMLALRRPLHKLWLGHELDRDYEAATNIQRIIDQKRILVVFSIFYASAITLDAILGLRSLGLVVRFGMTMPVILICLLSLSARQPYWLQGLLGTLPVIMIGSTTSMIGVHLEDMMAQRYMFATALFMTHVNISFGQRWFWTVSTAVGGVVSVWAVLLKMRGWAGAASLVDLAVFNSVIMLATLYWAFRAEHRRRDDFLHGQLAQLHAETLARANRELETLSLTDALTGLANRRAFDREFGRAWLRSQQAAQSLGLLLIDIDHFKAFNDGAGHLAGDACLRQVADVMRDGLQGMEAFSARFGGEEFAVLLPGCDEISARAVGHRLRVAVRNSGLINPGQGQGRPLTISVGLVSTFAGALDTTAMLGAADAGLYRAKHLGRNCVASGLEPSREEATA